VKSVKMHEAKIDLETAIRLAREEPLLLVTDDGREFLLSEADDFEKEVEALRSSAAFQRFLEERSQSADRISLDEVESAVKRELAKTEVERRPQDEPDKRRKP